MAELNLIDQLTLLQQAQLIGPDGGILQIAEVLDQENEILKDAVTQMANGIRAHVSAVRTDLPAISTRKINRGATTVDPMSSQVEDQIMLLEAWPKIDEQLVDPYPNPAQMRGLQMKAYIEAFAQSFTENLIYGNPADIGEIRGWANTYNALSMANVDGYSGSGGDTTSLWMAEWDIMKLSLIYPKGSPSVGLFNMDWGKKMVYDTASNPYAAYVSQMKMELGWANPDPRALQRLTNIESTGTTNNLTTTTGHHPIVAARGRLPKRGAGRTAIYVNRDLLYQFDIWAMDKTNGFYYQQNITGGPLMVFQGIPIRLVEQILSTEAVVS